MGDVGDVVAFVVVGNDENGGCSLSTDGLTVTGVVALLVKTAAAEALAVSDVSLVSAMILLCALFSVGAPVSVHPRSSFFSLALCLSASAFLSSRLSNELEFTAVDS